jgi:tetratricopeptide (TPR) repeat protein
MPAGQRENGGANAPADRDEPQPSAAEPQSTPEPMDEQSEEEKVNGILWLLTTLAPQALHGNAASDPLELVEVQCRCLVSCARFYCCRPVPCFRQSCSLGCCAAPVLLASLHEHHKLGGITCSHQTQFRRGCAVLLLFLGVIMQHTCLQESAKRKADALAEKEQGNAAYKRKDFQNAVEHYDKALELFDGDISFLTNR